MSSEGSARRIARRTLPCVLALVLGASGAAWAQAETPATQAQEPTAGREAAPPEKTIKMVASNWHWKPNLIRVPLGTRLRLEFQSYDASHSFVLKAYGIKKQLPEGKTGEVEFVADKAGEFKWRCGRPCGNGCAKMVGKLIVE